MSNAGHVQICCFLLIILVRHVACQNTNFSFPGFNSTDPRFIMLGDAASMDSSMYLNNKYYTYNVSNSCGRFLYPERVRMMDPPTGQVASFNTSFTFEIMLRRAVNAVDGQYMNGEGFAFTISPDTTTVDATGEILCNTKTFADTRIFAVEVDTRLTPDDSDPSDSHIAIDLNSALHSVIFPEYIHNLCQDSPNTSYCGYFANNPGTFTVWVDYDGTVLEVRFSSGSNPFKPASPIIVAAPNLRTVLNEFTYVGFSGSFGDYKEAHRILSWSFSSSGLQSSAPSPQPAVSPAPSPLTALSPAPEAIASRSNNNVGLISGIVSGILGITFVVLGSIFILSRRRKKKNQGKESSLKLQRLMGPRIFTYRELSKATKEFSDSVLIGSGGFGAVYKGTLQPSGAVVAVKRCSRPDNAHAEEGFVAEATSISQIRHRNLVQLQGWCQERGQLLLVYDYMPNRSLDEWLFNRAMLLSDATVLTWELRYNILAGVAAALAYLHEEWQQCVLHRDIKASNVMLDAEFNAHLGDFGLARLIDHRKAEKTTELAGTLGYMAPEMYYTGKATKESDVYSFGVLILEVVCGRKPLNMRAPSPDDVVLLDCVWRAHEAGDLVSMADPRLGTHDHIATLSAQVSNEALEAELGSGPFRVSPNSVKDILQLGLLCCLLNPSKRPSMRLVKQMFQTGDAAALPPLPASKPPTPYAFAESEILSSIAPSSYSLAAATSDER